jgi:PHP domain-containing protein
VEDPLGLHGLACVAHVHSTYSDGTATVAELVEAAEEAGADCVLLTDHDTLEARRRGEEGWRGSVLMLVGHEVSPKAGHLLVFGLDEEIPHAGRTERDICTAVLEAGGVAFAAHPFSQGSRMSKVIGPPHGWTLLDEAVCGGIELWSLASDAAESWRTPWEAAAFLRDPMRALSGPPPRHLAIWDRLCRHRRVPAIGGLDAHQMGIRIRGRVRTPMPNARYFALLHTHVLLPSAPTGDLAADRVAVNEALAEGRCYLSFEALAPGRGFRFWAESDGGAAPMGARVDPGRWTLRAVTPRRARLRLLRDGVPVHEGEGEGMEHVVEEIGCYRLEARLPDDARERLWLVANPVYVRPAAPGG